MTATYSPLAASPLTDSSPTSHETQASLFKTLPRGLPFFKENSTEGIVYARLANRQAIAGDGPSSTTH